MSFSVLQVEIHYGPHGERLYSLVRSLTYKLAANGGTIRIRVPKGYITNFATTPWWAWGIFPPDGPWAAASVVHDYLYEYGLCSRFLADAIFRDAMADLGVPLYLRWPMWAWVRVFAWLPWRSARRRRA